MRLRETQLKTRRVAQKDGTFQVVLRRADVIAAASARLQRYCDQVFAQDDITAVVSAMYGRVTRSKEERDAMYKKFNEEIQSKRVLTSIHVPVSMAFVRDDNPSAARFIITVYAKLVDNNDSSTSNLIPPPLPGSELVKNPEEEMRGMHSREEVQANYDVYVYRVVGADAMKMMLPAYVLYFTNVFTILRNVDREVYALCAAFAERTSDTTDVGGTFVSSKLRIV